MAIFYFSFLTPVVGQESVQIMRLPPVNETPADPWSYRDKVEESGYELPGQSLALPQPWRPSMQSSPGGYPPVQADNNFAWPAPATLQPPVGQDVFSTSPYDYPYGSSYEPTYEPHFPPPEAPSDKRYPLYTSMPASLLWEVPLANQREPRMYGKFTNLDGDLTIETAIGTEFGVWRLSPAGRPNEGIQLDVFAAVFTRFSNDWILMTNDFRVGVPLTFASGPWQGKIAFEHTSTHLGDEYIEQTGQFATAHVHDEIVLGLARRTSNNFRFYGQFAYSFAASRTIRSDKTRFHWGIEWSRCLNCWTGCPFAAFDMDLRSVQDFTPNITFQAGWQWFNPQRGRSTRLAFEVYNGKSPYGQFYRNREDWVGVSILYDW